MKTETKKTRCRGFTLVELLVVILVIALLAAMAVPRFIEVRNKSFVGAAIHDAGLVRKVLAYYEVDWNSYPAVAASYADLEAQLIDINGRPYGQMPPSNTFSFVSYGLDLNNLFVLRVQARDNSGTILRCTPDGIVRE
jgi:prepilin-type N-terminal cleavage/methylation domain-containing protein